MTDLDRGFVATAAVEPISWVLWADNHWLVYIAGVRTGSVIAGQESAIYRSITGGSRLFGSLRELETELTRLANWIVVANAEFTRREGLYPYEDPS